MSHDLEAAWASTELANHFKRNPSQCFGQPPQIEDLSVFASRDSKSVWPIADGVLELETAEHNYRIAVEFKRENEGLHGILTGIGQAHAYLHKSFSGAVLVLPSRYESLPTPGIYAKNVLDLTSGLPNIGVFTYEAPDLSRASPFEQKLTCLRSFQIDSKPAIKPESRARPETQWAHLREGSSFPDAFFRYLQLAKSISFEKPTEPQISLLTQIKTAVRQEGATNALKFLSNTAGDDFSDRVWRHFWFQYVFTRDVMPLDQDAPTRLKQMDGTPVRFFASRADSIKSRLVRSLRSHELTEQQAWRKYVGNVHTRAHSFREDIDSGLEHIGLPETDGKPSELGYKFIDACERSGDPNTGTPKRILGGAILQHGQLGAFLHYVYKLSDKKFKEEPLSFTELNGNPRFNRSDYLLWIEDVLANQLHVMRKGSLRGGTARKPFQGELAILRKFDFVGGFRLGVGLEINWPSVHDALNFVL